MITRRLLDRYARRRALSTAARSPRSPRASRSRISGTSSPDYHGTVSPSALTRNDPLVLDRVTHPKNTPARGQGMLESISSAPKRVSALYPVRPQNDREASARRALLSRPDCWVTFGEQTRVIACGSKSQAVTSRGSTVISTPAARIQRRAGPQHNSSLRASSRRKSR
jgi:hypothetical protein